MGTKNPKISAYVPQEVFDRFQEFQNERNLSASKAATAIFCDYFGIGESTGVLPSGITAAQFEELKENFKLLTEQVQGLQEKVDHQPVYQDATLMGAEIKSLKPENETPQLPFPNSEPLETESKPLEPEVSVLSGKELAERFSISSSKLSTEKGDRSHEQFTEWSKKIDPDGFAWTYRGKQKGKGVEYLQVQ